MILLCGEYAYILPADAPVEGKGWGELINFSTEARHFSLINLKGYRAVRAEDNEGVLYARL